MAFNKKTWKDRVSEQPQRRLLTPTDGGEAMTVDVTRQEGIVIQEGDAFSAANMNDLETRIKNTFDSDESTLAAVNTKANTNTSNIASLQTNLTSVSNRVTTNANNIAINKTTETNHYNALDTRATTLENELTANNKRIYMDYKNGKYGINTSANRGADTFIPFNDMSKTYYLTFSLLGNLAEGASYVRSLVISNNKQSSMATGQSTGNTTSITLNGITLNCYYSSGWHLSIDVTKAGKLYDNNGQLLQTFDSTGGTYVGTETSYYFEED